MRKTLFSRIVVIALMLSLIIGCAQAPKGFLKPTEGYLEKRQLQIRQYDTTNEEQVLSSVTGVLQDLGFTLDNSETKVGFIAASKTADATSKGQLVAAFFLDLLCAFGGNSGGAVSRCDKTQVFKASVITKQGLNSDKTVVRITFQRIIWNMDNQISRVETVNDPEVYQAFYEGLSKAMFLEAQQI